MSNDFLLFLIFGPAYVLAGLQAILTREMSLPRSGGQTLEGGVVTWIGLCYLLWGGLLSVTVLQSLQRVSPTVVQSITTALNIDGETAITVFLVVNFGLVGLPWVGKLFQPRG